MSNLISPRELRHWASEPRDYRTVESALLDAADTLERKDAEIAKLRAALELISLYDLIRVDGTEEVVSAKEFARLSS